MNNADFRARRTFGLCSFCLYVPAKVLVHDSKTPELIDQSKNSLQFLDALLKTKSNINSLSDAFAIQLRLDTGTETVETSNKHWEIANVRCVSLLLQITAESN
jgi:hypothetical protein